MMLNSGGDDFCRPVNASVRVGCVYMFLNGEIFVWSDLAKSQMIGYVNCVL